MDPYSEGFCCPWIHLLLPHMQLNAIAGVLIMQDWGTQDADPNNKSTEPSDSINQDIDYLRRQTFPKDKTCSHLFNSGWRSVIWEKPGSWLVTNAVWGRRKKGAEMCGYLGASTHKLAYPIWRKLLLEVAKYNKNLQVVFAGSWARFENPKQNTAQLSDYLQNWDNWVVPKDTPNLLTLEGKAYFSHHPSTWSPSTLYNGAQGPPP